MPIPRLLAFAAALICSVSASAQSEPLSRPIEQQHPNAAVAEPWRIIPIPAPDSEPATPVDVLNLRGQKLPTWATNTDAPTSLAFSPQMFPPPTAIHPAPDDLCYAIRSYVVARDDKDSDSTHPAGYSTCQSARRYQLKNADLGNHQEK